jgi:hypothetical protein
MPMFTHQCLNAHTRDAYAHSPIERACRTILCVHCHHTMSPVISLGQGLTYFAEGGGGKWIHNLGPEPVFVTSTAQHERIMKEQGVTWMPQKRGMPGCWS